MAEETSKETSEEYRDEIKYALDQQLKKSMEESEPLEEFAGFNFMNVNLMPVPALQFEGASGTGKTARINQWAEANKDKINFVSIPAESLQVTKVAKDGEEYKVIFTTELAQKLKEPKTVLFIDNYQFIKNDVQEEIFNLIDNRAIIDISEDDPVVYLNDIYFIVVAVTN